VPSFSAIGQQAEDGGQRGHENGAKTDAARLGHGLAHGQAFILDQPVGELNDEDAVGDDDADHHDDAHERHDV
jgi:hypothetical protein